MMVKSSPDLVIAVRDQDRSEDEPHHQLCKGLQTIEEVEIHGSPPDQEINKVAETETMERRAPRPSSTDLPKRTTRGESMNFDESQTERGAESAVSFRKLPFRIRLAIATRSEEHTSELQSLRHLVCRLLLEKKKKKKDNI